MKRRRASDSKKRAMANSVTEELELKLEEVGTRLASPPADVDQLLYLLDQAKSLLSRVCQNPSASMLTAMRPAVDSLVTKELLKNSKMDVKITVASCIIEITRITSPEHPYDSDILKEILKEVVDAFKELDDISNHLFLKRVSILKTFADLQLCFLMLDLECNDLIFKMFQHFLKTIRPNHTTTVFSSMEIIMTNVLAEINDVPQDLLFSLLSPLKARNKDVLPIARRLAEKVIANCARHLKFYLNNFRSSGISFSDYNSEILTSICQENSDAPEKVELNTSGKCLEPVKLASEVCCPGEMGTFADNLSKSLVRNGTVLRSGDNYTSGSTFGKQGASYSCSGSQLKNDVAINGGRDKSESTIAVKSDGMRDHNAKKSTCKRSNSQSQLTGVYGRLSRHLGKKALLEITDKGKKRHTGTISKYLEVLSYSETKLQRKKLRTGKDPLSGSSGKRQRHRMRQRKILEKEDVPGDMSLKVPGKQNGENLVGSKIEIWWPADRRFYAGNVISFDPVSKKHEIVYDDGDVEILLLREEQWHFVEDVKTEAVSGKQNGENLVGSKIEVWWPGDERFYAGDVISFDPVSKRHMILYTDNDVETLLLSKERWQYVEKDGKKEKGQAKDIPKLGSSPELAASRLTTNCKSNLEHEQWSPEETEELLRLLVEEVKNGQRLDNGCFRKESILQVVLPKLNAQFGNKREYDHVQDMLRVWRQKLDQMEQIASSASGFRWDPETQRFTVPEGVWEELKKVHSNVYSFRNRAFGDYENLRKVIGHNFSLGTVACGVDKSMDVQDSDEDTCMETEHAAPPVSGLPVDSSHGLQPCQASHPHSAAHNAGSISSSEKHKAAANMSPSKATSLASALDGVGEGLRFLGNALQCFTNELHDIQHRNYKWKEAINSTPGLTDELKWKALELSTTQEMKDTFVSMCHDQRKRWLFLKLGGF